MELVPGAILPSWEELKEAGLLQSLRIYELMYGGKSLAFGIKGMPLLPMSTAKPFFDWSTLAQIKSTSCSKSR